MSEIQKIINFVLEKVEILENADKETTVRTLAILETALTAINRAVETVPSYAQTETINAILGIVEERGEANESK